MKYFQIVASVFLAFVVLIFSFREVAAGRSDVNNCPDEHKLRCRISPCDDKKCLDNAQAVCYDDYCGGCSMRWFLPDDTEITCQNIDFDFNY